MSSHEQSRRGGPPAWGLNGCKKLAINDYHVKKCYNLKGSNHLRDLGINGFRTDMRVLTVFIWIGTNGGIL
jgi:hypothetical protein